MKIDQPVTRWAVIKGPPGTIDAYMGGRYHVIGVEEDNDTIYTFIEGEDFAGWTLEDYIKPRLESGLWFGLEELTFDPFDPDVVRFDGIQPWPKED